MHRWCRWRIVPGMRTRCVIASTALAFAGALTTACQPTQSAWSTDSAPAALVAAEPFVDVLRIDCTQPGWFSVQTSSTSGYTLELRTGSGVPVWSGPSGGVQRATVRDWHPTRGGHIDKIRAVLIGTGASNSATTPFCGVVLEPEASDVEA